MGDTALGSISDGKSWKKGIYGHPRSAGNKGWPIPAVLAASFYIYILRYAYVYMTGLVWFLGSGQAFFFGPQGFLFFFFRALGVHFIPFSFLI